jgi:hypothetical protein
MDDAEKEGIGRMVGAGMGAAGGAQLGSIVLPVPIVGPFAGGVVGALVGSELGRRFGKALINGGEAFIDTLRAELPDTRPPPPLELHRGGYA